MKWCLCARVAVCLAAGLSMRAQETAANPGDPPSPETQPSGSNVAASTSRLPVWLHIGFEFRGREEANDDVDRDRHEWQYLNRLRLNATIEPAGWARFFVQAQDARAARFGGTDVPDQRNGLELHQGYLELGALEEGVQFRFGRQQLAVGDERLVAADDYWDWCGQTFDAVRVALIRRPWRLESFAGFRVEPGHRHVNPFDTSSRVSGLTFALEQGWGMVEPYLIWKRGGDTLDLLGRPGHRDVVTPGVLLRGNAAPTVEFDVEMAVQRGHVVGDWISAWAGHWELGWHPFGKEKGPRLGLEYNYASGDANPADGRHRTFDDIYPAGYNKFGMLDPIAWRNTSYPMVSVEMPLAKKWRVLTGYRSYWLAQLGDGLYEGGDEYQIRNPAATSSHVGSQLLFSGAFVPSEHWRIYAGYGLFFAGAFVRQSNYASNLTTIYIQPSYSF